MAKNEWEKATRGVQTGTPSPKLNGLLLARWTRKTLPSGQRSAAMETFLLQQAAHDPLFLPLLEWHDLESLSSCSARLVTSLIRDVYFQRAVVVVPHAPRSELLVRNALAKLSLFTRDVTISNPHHFALLGRLPQLNRLRVAKPKAGSHDDDDEDTEPVSLSSQDVEILWNLSTVVELELDAWVQDIVVLFRDMVRLQTLDLVFRYRIGSIDLLAHLHNLHSLRIRGDTLGDISAVGALTNLQSLEMASWGIHDISAVDRLVGLERLDLSRTNIMDLNPIRGLTKLCCLKLEETPVEDLEPLAELSSLEYLSLARSQVSDLSALQARRPSLRYLDISGCTLARVDCLRTLQRLECLRLHKTTLSNLRTEQNISAAIACLRNLRIVDGRVNAMFTSHPEGIHGRLELASLRNMASLEELEITNASFAGAFPCVALPQLVSLRIEWEYTKEPDIPLAVVHPRLRVLRLTRVRLQSLQNLKFAPQLQELRLIDVYLVEFSSLQLATELTHFELTCAMVHNHSYDQNEQPHQKAPTHDIDALRALTKLQHLDLSYSSIRSLRPLQVLRELRSVDLSCTDVTDVSPLNALTQLECVLLRETEIRRFDGGAFCRRLRELALPEHVDCRAIRLRAQQLKRLLHPDRDCLWTGHEDVVSEDMAVENGMMEEAMEQEEAA